MHATAWNGGGNTYGIRVGKANRQKFFDPNWKVIEVELDGQFHLFTLTDGFWRNCPEFRDRGKPIIRDWLQQHRSLRWPNKQPPSIELIPLGEAKFRVVS